MNYYEIFGEPISKEDEAFINVVERFVNGRMTNPQKIGKGLSTMHRYLQHQAFKIVVAYMRHSLSTSMQVDSMTATSGQPRQQPPPMTALLRMR